MVVLVGSTILTKRLIEGVVEEWDDEKRRVRRRRDEGRVQPGEIVSIKYLGDREGAKYDYPTSGSPASHRFPSSRPSPLTRTTDRLPRASCRWTPTMASLFRGQPGNGACVSASAVSTGDEERLEDE